MEDATLRAENARLRDEIARLERDLAGSRDGRNTIIGLKEMVLTVGSSDRLVELNSAAERFFGIRRDEVLGLPVDVLSCPPVDGTMLRQLAERVRRTRDKVAESVGDGTEAFLIAATPAPEGVQFLITDSAARRTRNTLVGYLSASALEQLGRVLVDPLQTRRVDCTAVVAEVRTSRDLPAGVEKSVRDEWGAAMAAAVYDTGATLEGFSAGRVTALFGAPAPSDDHSLWAVNTAMRMKEAHRALALAWTRRGLPACPSGFGIDTGSALWGESGAEQRRTFTAMGVPAARAALLATLAEADTIVASSKAFELVRALLEKRPEGLWRPAKFKRGEIVRLAAGEEPGQTVVIAD